MNPSAIKTDDFEFTRDDAISLCSAWQDYTRNRQTGSWQGDNVETLIEELCLAWGFSKEEVRATFVRK